MAADVYDYIKRKNKLGEYSDENRVKLQKDSELNLSDKLAAALAAAGAGISGGDSMSAGRSVLEQRGKEKRNKLDDFEKGRAARLQDISFDLDQDRLMREEEIRAREEDANSEESKLADGLLRRMGYRGAPITAARFKQFSPTYQKLFEIEQERIRKANEKAKQDKELSATQAKQAGLYKSGTLANQQYDSAVAPGSGYDPTEIGQFIDNSTWAPSWLKDPKAVEARAAQDNWIESFLRDASGAAIPESERESYREQFFPVPGDPQSVVLNKAVQRQQKMENARIGAGNITPISAPDIPPSVQQQARAELEKRRAAKKVAGGSSGSF